MNKPLIFFVTLLLLGCAQQLSPPAMTAPRVGHAETASLQNTEEEESLSTIRYALVAPSTSANIWAIFDEEGATYENYALFNQNYPRLYHLSPPNNELTPLIADDFPSPIVQEGEYFTTTIFLRPNLLWDDGSPLTAKDIVFTINTVLDFELGLNWAKFYNKDKLHHVEALDALRLKYYFSSPPNAGDWQHGALIGVFTSQAYWEPKVATANYLLPLLEDERPILEYQVQIDALQAEADIISRYMRTLKVDSPAYREEEQQLADRQARRDSFKQKIEVIQREKREKFLLARAAIYALSNANEPTIQKNFAHYTTYERSNAIQALLDNEADFILAPNGLIPEEIAQLSTNSDIHIVENRRNDIRFLTFNHKKTYLDDIALRRALFCLIDPEILATERLESRVVPALGWIHPENIGWYSSTISPPCAGMDASARLAAGTRILQKAGYAWEQEPSPDQVGSGLRLPSGALFPSITLLAPREDPSRVESASYIEELAQQLGIPLRAEIVPADDLFFAVYGIGNYDLAVLGWSLSLYPDYLCDFFAEGNPYNYMNSAVNAKCAELAITSDITLARQQLFEIEILLWDDLPAIPLFSSKITEAYRNFSLPFESYLGGFVPTLYGVPPFR